MPLRNSALKQWDRGFPSLDRRQLISGKRFFRSVGVNLLWVVLIPLRMKKSPAAISCSLANLMALRLPLLISCAHSSNSGLKASKLSQTQVG